ncbi:hypothetical protein BRN76_11000 [Xanthomonas oryzae pv. oryzae]|nr:hypothetical protein BRO15_12040 [Xanthomonas oryzae pv. oryzae]RBB02044.1 hypothetical protein BRN75_01610 [Xanthomonas oryzae pv. oryzae]RBB08942.1 hypothetical protein BRN92_09845 [Xanthomonas oryzae pv. oryzae]RBC38970.1 hypothetical protein BRN17_14545 [Xanthomonas oryzae pv. oryzae]RBC41138.1 hypothetical protein BRN12_13815 [Xanthomonas oryzae pv. oryzae]
MAQLDQWMAQVDLVLQTRTKQLIGMQLLGSRTACPHGRKLPETRTWSNEHWQFQHTENADEALQWMRSGGFQGRLFKISNHPA